MNQKHLIYIILTAITFLLADASILKRRMVRKENPVIPVEVVEDTVPPKTEDVVTPPQEQVQITADTYEQALEKAKEFKKPVLAFFHADWCHFCKKMEEETLSDAKVKELMKNFVFVKVNTSNNRNLVRKYNLRGIPAYVIVDQDEKKIKFDKGFKDANEFSKWLSDSKDNEVVYLFSPRL